ncbi:uncharacterized protein I206_105701 [Kwoniella pini CBS 10737]|uniref:Uncharacterized protein n=1 Tax=Kwoniella pini CBS 10737 TaxID=1296096 RepID=A0A1B9I3H1_9TREE|nr:uncharacterized protein I206_03396 [Kwoniella pini CBS 10737]OCF50079.1 hypothetical protein I206_03396 [Kwoniella pini CBS 10737]
MKNKNKYHWETIPISRPNYIIEDYIDFLNLLLPKPYLKKTNTFNYLNKNSIKSSKSFNEHKSGNHIKRKGSKIWLKSKRIRLFHSSLRKEKDLNQFPNCTTKEIEHGISMDDTDENWQIITIPFVSIDSTETEGSHSQFEEEINEGIRRIKAISRENQSQPSIQLYESDISVVEKSEDDLSSTSFHNRISNIHSSIGSESEERSSKFNLNKYQFPSSPSTSFRSNEIQNSIQNDCAIQNHSRYVMHKRSWLEGGPLTILEERQEIERELPNDHPFNSPIFTHSFTSSPLFSAHQSSHYSVNEKLTSSLENNLQSNQSHIPNNQIEFNEYNHFQNLFYSLKIMKEILYENNESTIKLLYLYEDIIPLSILREIENRLNKYWIKWTNILNSLGQKIVYNLNQFNISKISSSSSSSSLSLSPLSKKYLNSLIPPPIIQDEIIRLIWSLEEKFQIPSGTYKRMFGNGNENEKIKKMTIDEELEADQMRLRDWMIDEDYSKQRVKWRENKR